MLTIIPTGTTKKMVEEYKQHSKTGIQTFHYKLNQLYTNEDNNAENQRQKSSKTTDNKDQNDKSKSPLSVITLNIK